METPREVLFRTMQETWAISNKDLAHAILLEDSVTSGKSPQELVAVRSSLSRFVVHVQPGEYTYGWLAPLNESIPKVMALVKCSKRPHASADIIQVLGGRAADDMRASLDGFGLDGALYTNVSARFANDTVASPADVSEVLLTLFVAAGCLGDVAQAAQCAVSTADRLAAAMALRTALPVQVNAADSAKPLALGLYRCENGVLLSGVYRLSTDSAGTEIGALSLTKHPINDVGYGVSRRHVRIWRDTDGAWWVEGLGSTNGTDRIDADGVRTVVELPRALRAAKGGALQPSAVRLTPGDRLILAGTTEFAVVALPEI